MDPRRRRAARTGNGFRTPARVFRFRAHAPGVGGRLHIARLCGRSLRHAGRRRRRAPAAPLTATSLAVVCVNATSGTIAYTRMRRVDFRSALVFGAAGLPGSVLGAWTTQFVNRRIFDPLLGTALILGALVVL